MLSVDLLRKMKRIIEEFNAIQTRGFAKTQEELTQLKNQAKNLMDELKQLGMQDSEVTESLKQLENINRLLDQFPVAKQLNDLPDEILLPILSNLDNKNLSSVARICRQFNTLSKEDALWKARLEEIPDPEKTLLLVTKEKKKLSFKQAFALKLPPYKSSWKLFKPGGLEELEFLVNTSDSKTFREYIFDLLNRIRGILSGQLGIGMFGNHGRKSSSIPVIGAFIDLVAELKSRKSIDYLSSKPDDNSLHLYKEGSFQTFINILIYATRISERKIFKMIMRFLNQVDRFAIAESKELKFFDCKLSATQIFDQFLKEEYRGFLLRCIEDKALFSFVDYFHPIFYVIDTRKNDFEAAKGLINFFIANHPICLNCRQEIDTKALSPVEYAFYKAVQCKANIAEAKQYYALAKHLLFATCQFTQTLTQSTDCLESFMQLGTNPADFKESIKFFNVTSFGIEFLRQAIFYENPVAINFFIKNHSHELKIINSKGETFWHIIDLNKLHKEEVQISLELLKLGHHLLMKKNPSGQTAIEIIFQQKQIFIIELMIKEGYGNYVSEAKITESLLDSDHKDYLLQLLQTSKEVNAADSFSIN